MMTRIDMSEYRAPQRIALIERLRDTVGYDENYQPPGVRRKPYSVG
ncbi:MAG: hypothetical protein ACLR76_10860 [Alistipes sp.]